MLQLIDIIVLGLSVSFEFINELHLNKLSEPIEAGIFKEQFFSVDNEACKIKTTLCNFHGGFFPWGCGFFWLCRGVLLLLGRNGRAGK